MARVADVVWFIYFVLHILVAVAIDSQGIMPRQYYPKQLVDVLDWYRKEYKDCFMGPNMPPWFMSFVYCEMFLQLPFFFVAAYAYFKGARACPWIRVPNLVYCTHVITTMIAILTHMALADFRQSKGQCPQTQKERLSLIGVYLPILIIPLLMFLDTAFSSAYFPRGDAGNTGSKKKR